MKWQASLLALAVVGSQARAQDNTAGTALPPVTNPAPVAAAPPLVAEAAPAYFSGAGVGGGANGFLTGTHEFPRFIGWMSNPLMNIDPRSLTEFWPVFGSAWTTAFPPLPSGDFQLYGGGLNLALTDRLSMGLNQGGFADAHYNQSRDGWLNLGGFAQYTLIKDVPDQFLLTVGLRLEAPTGEAEVFQGHGPAHMAGYATVGKEFGEFHVLATGGYHFPLRDVHDGTDVFYLNGHIDRRVFCWLYPLFEVNWIYHTTGIDLNRSDRPDFFNFGTFEVTGNTVSMAVGANAVLVPEKLEFGMAYTRSLATQHDFEFNGLIAKLVLRY
jgi:hypothetical protein